MCRLPKLFFSLLVICSPVLAKAHSFGFHAAVGTPLLTSFGLNYVLPGGMFSAELARGGFGITVSDVSVSLYKNEAAFRWHPFLGSFYVGIGVGQQTLSAKSSESILTQSITAEIDVTSNTMTPHLGWMWGKDDGGLFVGLDLGYQSPAGVDTKLTTNADSTVQATAEYQQLEVDVRKQGNDLGNTALPILTLLRIGYLF